MMAAMLSQSFDITLVVSTKLLKILFGLSSSSSLLYLSMMKSVLLNSNSYDLTDVQGLHQAIGGNYDEVVSLRIQIQSDQIGYTSEEGPGCAFHLSLIIVNVLHRERSTLY